MKKRELFIKKLNHENKVKLIKFTVSYILKMLLLLYLLFACVSEAMPSTQRVITGPVQNIEVDDNPGYFDVINITINNETFPFVWDRLQNRSEVFNLILLESEVFITVKKYKNFFLIGDSFIERIVDIRTNDRIYYDIEYSNDMQIVYLILSICLFIFLALVFSVWYLINIRFAFKRKHKWKYKRK